MSEVESRLEREAEARTVAEQREYERKEVAAHYDHHPEIFMHVLDSQLAYATGVFLNPQEDLETAQQRKFAQVCQQLAIQPGERVLDVGCGWGSIMLYLAAHTEGSFHGITLSVRQREIALQRAKERGLDGKIKIDLTHVEDLNLEPESVDVVYFSGSIVHMRHRDKIHNWVGKILRPGGRLLISDCYYPQVARGNRDSAATYYIFHTALGYCKLLTLWEELAMIEKSGLDILHVGDVTASYALTLGHWIDNIRKNRALIEQMSPGFSRILQNYMTVAKLSFAQRTALEYMILATKGRPSHPGPFSPRNG